MRRAFEMPVEGGIRLKLAHVLTLSELGIATIDHLFGPSGASQILPNVL